MCMCVGIFFYHNSARCHIVVVLTPRRRHWLDLISRSAQIHFIHIHGGAFWSTCCWAGVRYVRSLVARKRRVCSVGFNTLVVLCVWFRVCGKCCGSPPHTYRALLKIDSRGCSFVSNKKPTRIPLCNSL